MTRPPLRICVLGDLESVHTRRWMLPFVERGHEVHAVSYYPLSSPIEGVTVHALTGLGAATPTGDAKRTGSSLAGRLPPTPLRLLNALRYRRRGLADAIRRIQPHVLHAHYAVEYGFFAATTGYHPLVVTAWGSDILVAAERSRYARRVARYALRRADLVTSNNEYMTGRIRDLGVPAGKAQTVVFGTERFFLEADDGVNARSVASGYPPTVISTRSLDSPLYRVDLVLKAMAVVRRRLPDARLLVAGSGRLQPTLERLAGQLEISDAVTFLGFLDRAAFRDALASAHVYVSVPASDATSVSTLSAMAVGCFPVLSDLPTQHEWIEDGANGLLVPVGNVDALAEGIVRALEDEELRRQAVALNRRRIEERGLWENESLRMEELYYDLADVR
ncbi:MAG: glycosyltransferase [Dehalococcoidia bacterium]|nr:glycosyltransferase [Dehalococcoidia bacterium]